MLLNLLNRVLGVFRAIVEDRLGNGAIAIDRHAIGRIGYAGARPAQDQAQR